MSKKYSFSRFTWNNIDVCKPNFSWQVQYEVRMTGGSIEVIGGTAASPEMKRGRPPIGWDWERSASHWLGLAAWLVCSLQQLSVLGWCPANHHQFSSGGKYFFLIPKNILDSVLLWVPSGLTMTFQLKVVLPTISQVQCWYHTTLSMYRVYIFLVTIAFWRIFSKVFGWCLKWKCGYKMKFSFSELLSQNWSLRVTMQCINQLKILNCF